MTSRPSRHVACNRPNPPASASSGITVRSAESDSWDAWDAVIQHAFGEGWSPESRAAWDSLREPDRCLSAYLGTELVGTAGAYSFSMTVPGGAAQPVAGVTAVAVAPTARRRGVMRAMMRHQLHELHEHGREPLAALTASQPQIYGRFGYGLATWRMQLRARTGPGALPAAPAAAADVRMRLADPAEALPACRTVYDELLPSRPGLMARNDLWAQRQLHDPPAERGGASPLRCVLAEADGQVRGYAYYATKPEWGQEGPHGRTVVREVHALDPVTRLALWRYLFDLDLMSHLEVNGLAPDDPLLHQLTDVRAAKPSFMDGMYLRLVDAGRALAARTYAVPVDLVLDVHDAFCPWNTGRWRLTGDEHGARCERTTAAADVALGATELGSLYLGGMSAASLEGAARVIGLRPGAVARLGTAFAHEPLPLMAFGF
ncbi:GNAT family N-acetyltransferase [Yinghuangia seranimata]|uniref:GNAT family N-acetyltransferase n=1 Tax=Yinghuangia seranimata TaxID=408067 RepID=UPI00248D1EEB|nr:GNAT family N-acetyltransferase [Yinghuangia seranimata]MDI2125426.1 GNAT family N-acetyltransferase [Yinghuangia seranimata]